MARHPNDPTEQALHHGAGHQWIPQSHTTPTRITTETWLTLWRYSQVQATSVCQPAPRAAVISSFAATSSRFFPVLSSPTAFCRTAATTSMKPITSAFHFVYKRRREGNSSAASFCVVWKKLGIILTNVSACFDSWKATRCIFWVMESGMRPTSSGKDLEIFWILRL